MESKPKRSWGLSAKQIVPAMVCVSSTLLSAIYGCNSVGRMLALGASCPWFESKYPYLNGLCSVIRLAQDICNVLEEFKSHKVHTMFSCFHNVELLLGPSFG